MIMIFIPILFVISGVDVNYEVPERSGKIISTGTPFRLVYGVIQSSIKKYYDDHKKISGF